MASASGPRAAMEAALKAMIAERLRPNGFSDTFSHLRRRLHDRIDLISFQFFSSGGSFVVEVACCPPEGIQRSTRPVPPAKVTAREIGTPRPRIGGTGNAPQGNEWYVYGPPNYEPGAMKLMESAHYQRIAAKVADDIAEEAEPWWISHPFPKAL